MAAGLMIRSTRVGLSCEWTSLTTVSVSWAGISDAFGVRTGIGRAMHAASGADAASTDALRNSRRFISVIALRPPPINAMTAAESAHSAHEMRQPNATTK